MKLPRYSCRQPVGGNYRAVFSERIGERRHGALGQPAAPDEPCVYSERRGNGEQETQSRSARRSRERRRHAAR